MFATTFTKHSKCMQPNWLKVVDKLTVSDWSLGTYIWINVLTKQQVEAFSRCIFDNLQLYMMEFVWYITCYALYTTSNRALFLQRSKSYRGSGTFAASPKSDTTAMYTSPSTRSRIFWKQKILKLYTKYMYCI